MLTIKICKAFKINCSKD